MSVQSFHHDTIFALSSGRLPSGVAIIRLSGPKTRFITETIIGKLPEARKAVFSNLKSQTDEILDSGLTLFFEGPKSFTGEDCAEFHIHGGVAVVEKFLESLSKFEKCRLAEAGEFTRRAFANGKMDLTMAEGLADLISAETETQRRLAQQVASGAQRNLYMDWRQKLIQARAFIEAELDFADEGDVPGSVSDRVWSEMHDLSTKIEKHIEDGKRGSMLRDGFHIVIIGAPNAGKSSLMNLLAARDVAIISDEAGTTRDLLEVKLNLNGVATYVTDTAGIRETTGKVEQIGIQRAMDKAAEADLILYIEDISDPIIVDIFEFQTDIWTIGNKADLKSENTPSYDYLISTKNNEGINNLLDNLSTYITDKTKLQNDVVPTRRRHIDLLNQCKSEIETAVKSEALPLELRAENLRIASQHLGKITGDVDVEDILDLVFSQFCIGK
ncbi:MAG TPA: tRNA uridine-5-carboxymethylaminomethyl(34) synthesis GTPase MnmE [Pseudochrobactrum sp.]|nr:tRNA uridine-5-carboxymethylaminomethyl(34) synthesis GTPase MnmE [Pseudochrobactrum sp.]